MDKLPISVGILAWNSGQTLIDTLETYKENGLFDIVNDVTIFFQEFTDFDKEIAEKFQIPAIGIKENVGIGKAFTFLANIAKSENVLLLEHDWQLIEPIEIVRERLISGIKLLDSDVQCVRYRHRKHPGYPHFSFQYIGRELDYYDKEIECTSPHLLDSIHWLENPDEKFFGYISKYKDYYVSTSRYANWTNNPCMYKKEFYIKIVPEFAGEYIDLEGNISKWWARQSFRVAHGEGLFKHVDTKKYGNPEINNN
jgi:hypothetical protein